MKRFLPIALVAAFCSLPALADPNPGMGPARGEKMPQAVQPDATNAFFIEGGGPGLLYSLNYERLLEQEYGLRIGFSYQSFSATASGGGSTASASATIITVPVIASYQGLRAGNHVLELGAGGTAIYASGSASGTGMAANGSGMTAV